MHPQELTETERDIWKKYARKKKWKQPLPQLKMPVCQGQYDLAAFTGMQVTQLFMITAAGKWGLYQGGRTQSLTGLQEEENGKNRDNRKDRTARMGKAYFKIAGAGKGERSGPCAVWCL